MGWRGREEKLIFRYDHQGRRTAKEAWKKVAGVYQKQGWDFMYDGWNLIAEGGRLPTDYVLLRTYHWGLDLSGALQGAGGVGGLVMMR